MDPATIPDYKVSLGERAGSYIAVRNRRSSSATFALWLLSSLDEFASPWWHDGGKQNQTD